MGILPYTLKKKVMAELQKSYVTMHLPAPVEAPLIAIEEVFFGGGLDNIAIKQPIFIVGCHRSGTTVLYEALAKHPDLVFLTNASAFLPRIPILSNVVGSMFALEEVAEERFLKDGIAFTHATPSEGIRIWELHAPEGGDYCLDETHSNPKMERYLDLTIKKHLKHFKGKRFLNKNPDNSVRMRYLNKLFPDAYFINIVRDGRAVCSSLMKVREIAAEFFGPEHRHATSGVKVKAWSDIEETWRTDPVVSIGMLWREIVETVERDSKFITPDRYLEFRYEDFVAAPMDYLEKMSRFSQLRWDKDTERAFTQEAGKLNMGGRNDAWKKRLKDNDLERLMEIIGPKMREYGYL
ncbi:MAG: sulfotransferase [Gemmatimonadaceae bacterium]|nr:sulfotransferase [Gloeobacterales cyanobacterium ES-bin-141]